MPRYKAKPKTINIVPNFTNLLKTFAHDALSEMQSFASSNGTVDFERLYSFTHDIRMVLNSFDGSKDGIRALIQFREEFNIRSEVLFNHLNALRRKREKEQEP